MVGASHLNFLGVGAALCIGWVLWALMLTLLLLKGEGAFQPFGFAGLLVRSPAL